MADLNHSFDHFAFTSEEKEQLTDRLKQAAEQEERMKEPTKRIIRHTGHRLLIGAGAAAALTMGALAATVGGGLLGYFEARTPEDQSALENGIYRLDRSESWNGWTVALTDCVGDNATIKAEGERAVFETNIHGLHPELIKLLGRMKYRTSYGQNVLNHSIEVSHIAGLLASELGVDVATAKRAGLLHDIGKAIDHEVEGSHVSIGVNIARKYKESEEVIHAIEAHHGDVEAHTVVACLVQAADAISAARPGARRENIENYVKRLEKLEEVTKSFPGIANCFAIQAGREIRIMVKPEEVSEDQMVLLARDIAKKIEDELTYPGQIKVNLLRETKAVDYAK